MAGWFSRSGLPFIWLALVPGVRVALLLIPSSPASVRVHGRCGPHNARPSRAPHVQGTGGSGPAAWTGNRSFARNGTPNVKRPSPAKVETLSPFPPGKTGSRRGYRAVGNDLARPLRNSRWRDLLAGYRRRCPCEARPRRSDSTGEWCTSTKVLGQAFSAQMSARRQSLVRSDTTRGPPGDPDRAPHQRGSQGAAPGPTTTARSPRGSCAPSEVRPVNHRSHAAALMTRPDPSPPEPGAPAPTAVRCRFGPPDSRRGPDAGPDRTRIQPGVVRDGAEGPVQGQAVMADRAVAPVEGARCGAAPSPIRMLLPCRSTCSMVAGTPASKDRRCMALRPPRGASSVAAPPVTPGPEVSGSRRRNDSPVDME